ncbi:type II secretion system F family protein [Candidatus Woesearchaeota archaeon]|nr:type II secretion system F family protein [Candidatus Woesearchaeota archaeon]
MYIFLAKLYPKKLRDGYSELIRYSGIKIHRDKFMGLLLSLGFLLALASAFFLALFFRVPLLVSFILVFSMVQVLSYFMLLLRADAKARFVEEILPDVLQLMSSNLRAGLTTDKALLLSARPEFGPFQDEINQVGKEITMGKDISSALLEMGSHIKSETLNKTIALIVSGLKAGGELAALLEQTARNLRREALVNRRIRANIMMYVIFIFIAISFGAPLLFGLSSFLVEVLTNNLKSVELPTSAIAGTLPISFSSVSITPDFVMMFAVVFLVTSSILGSLILGLMSKGRERDGIKYMPILALISVAIFFLIRIAIKNMLGGLFGF